MSNSGSNLNKWRQPNSGSMDPSKAWIKNMGPGTSKRFPKTQNNHYNYPVQHVEQPRKPVNTFPAPQTFKSRGTSSKQDPNINKAMNDLQNLRISNGISEVYKEKDNLNEQTITMTYSQLMETVQKMIEANEKTDKFEVSSGTSKKCLQPVYMDEEDINDLIKSGHISINKGKLLYKKSKST